MRYGLCENGELLVFIVTQFKIDQNKNQNRSIDKVNQSIKQSTLFKQGTCMAQQAGFQTYRVIITIYKNLD